MRAEGSLLPHESAHKHVTGEAIYTDDAAARRDMLEVWPVCSPHARAQILRRDVAAARTMPGVSVVLLAEDVPGLNDVGAVRHDEILLADKEISFHGQLVALVVGETQEACRAAAAKVVVEYEPLAPMLTIAEAIAQNSFHTDANFIRRGDIARRVGRRAADARRRILLWRAGTFLSGDAGGVGGAGRGRLDVRHVVHAASVRGAAHRGACASMCR